MRTILFAILLILWMPVVAGAATCSNPTYVDYVGGHDTATGANPTTDDSTGALTHSPGDATCTSSAGVGCKCTPAAGTVINFKGGVRYRGAIVLNASGSAGNEIVYQTGPSWGTGNGIIDSADSLAVSWTQCSSAGDCWGNANYANIWYTSIPSGMTIYHTILQTIAGVVNRVYVAEQPITIDPQDWGHVSEYNPLPCQADITNGCSDTGDTKHITTTEIKDPDILTSASSTYYDGVYVAVWRYPNVVDVRAITSYTPATHTITFSALGNHPYYVASNQTNRYAVLNHPANIGRAGSFAIDTTNNRLYIWTVDSSDPNSATLELSKRVYGINGTRKDYITIKNLEFYGTYGNPAEWDYGGAIYICGSNYITIDTVDVHHTTSWTGFNSIDLRICTAVSDHNIVQNSIVRDTLGIRGVNLSGTNGSVKNNIFSRVDGTNIYFSGMTVGEISGNVVSETFGTHGNGCAVYQTSSDILVDRNKFIGRQFPFTTQLTNNLTFTNNICDGLGVGYSQFGGTMTGYLYVVNNDFLGSPGTYAYSKTGTPPSTIIFWNNIVDGGGYRNTELTAPNRQYNIYLSYATSWGQNDTMLQTGEVSYITQPSCTYANLFASYATSDYRIKDSSSYSKGNGVEASTYTTTDLLGLTRSAPWDIGAYKYGIITPSSLRGGSTTGTIK